MDKFCSRVIDVCPDWDTEKTAIKVEARYVLPDGNVYVAEYRCEVKRAVEEYAHPTGEKRVRYHLIIPGKEWLIVEYDSPNNAMIGHMLYHLVLPETRRTVIKILRKAFKPLGLRVPHSRSFVLRVEGFAFFLGTKGYFHLVP